MVKVLQCHHFSGQKVLCPKNEPVAAKVYKDRLFILTKRPGIQIHDLRDTESSRCIHIETTQVKQFHYLENQHAVVTLESGKKFTDLHVYIYHIFEKSLSAAKESSKEQVGPAFHCKTPVAGFVNPTCICTDTQAGNIGVGTKDHIYIYSVCEETAFDKPLTPCYHVKCLLQISVSVHVMRISLAEGFVLFGSDTQVQVLQLYVNYSDTLMGAETSSDNTSGENLPYSFVSSYMSKTAISEGDQWSGKLYSRTTSRRSSSGSSSSHSGVSLGSRDGQEKCQRVSDVTSRITQDKNHIYVVRDDSEAQGHGAVPIVWLKGIKKAHIKATSERLRRDEIILGPVKNHPRCSVFINYIASTELHSGQERSLLTFLFREVDQSTVTHIELRALYDPRAVDCVQSSGGLQSDNWRYLLGMLCYVSTHTEGYLYSLDPLGTQLLQTYQYSTEMLQLSLGIHHLYVATAVGIEIYTIDSAASLLLKASNSAGNAFKLCPRAREPCLVGLQPFFALTSISEDNNRVVVLSKVDGEQVWSIYALDKPATVNLCKDMISTGQLHQSSSLSTYMYMLQQTYNYIKASILLDGSTTVEDTILSDVAFYLGQVNASPPDDNWQLCVPYFIESGKHFSEILKRCTENMSAPPGRGMLNYIDFILFNKERIRKDESLVLEQKEAHLVLSLFSKWRPQLLSAVIVCSPLKGYDIEFTLGKLQSCSKEGIGREFYNKARDGLATAILHLAIGQLTEAEVSLGALTQKDVVDLCVENFHVLCLPNNDVATLRLSPIAQLLRKHNPYTVVEAFTKCVQIRQVSISSLHDLLASNVNDVHFIQILESLACDNSSESLFCDIANILKDVYIRHLKSKNQGQHHVIMMKYILPKRDGLFRDRYQWLNDVPPLQGTNALRKVCQNVSQEHQRCTTTSSTELLGNVSNDAVTMDTTSSLCPCTLCNADLLKLQGLTCSSLVTDGLLRDVLAESEHCPHLLSVQLICLLRTDVPKFAQTLFDSYPHLVAQIVQELTSENKHLSLVQAVIKYIFEKQREHQMSGDKQAENGTKVYLKEVLDALSETLTPEQFFQILPPDGNSRFFLCYVMRCLKLHQAQVVQEDITRESQTYLKKIMKA